MLTLADWTHLYKNTAYITYTLSVQFNVYLDYVSFNGRISVCPPPALLTPYVQGLVLGVFEEESSVQLSEAAARFDQTLSGKLSELLKM